MHNINKETRAQFFTDSSATFHFRHKPSCLAGYSHALSVCSPKVQYAAGSTASTFSDSLAA